MDHDEPDLCGAHPARERVLDPGVRRVPAQYRRLTRYRPCGFAQALITKLLVEEWGLTGYYRWLKGLKAQYRDRRDTLVDNLIAVSHAGLEAHQTSVGSFELRRSALSEKGDRSKPLLSFVAPQGGMFVWLRVHISQHRDYPAKSASSLIMALWTKLADNKVLLAPGTIFSGTTFGEPMDEFSGENLRIAQDGDGFFRLSFSSVRSSFEQRGN